MRSARLAFVAAGLLLGSAPGWAQTYDPSYPVCMQIYGPVRYLAVGRSASCLVNPYFPLKKPAHRSRPSHQGPAHAGR
ncbi:hypothetical protein CO669_24335 [Bradyrhizobium sp. Y36]|uniref:hypothetical protein n=1 Tax=Bradyrhizobium sp. Y36 TaxID=2035447 RepID=UPI000BE79509|nr:hypothetical protein [Bradyrhizobium sp. Y36]PDT87647.1 hypothetical protein CO669_24335 [Bradyrhizobium sp. Y36]